LDCERTVYGYSSFLSPVALHHLREWEQDTVTPSGEIIKKSMVLYFLSQNSFEHYRYYYRLNLANETEYVCTERFTSEKELQKYFAKDVPLDGNDGSPSAKKSSSSSSFKRKNNHHSLPRTGTTLDELLGRDEQKWKRNRNTLHKQLLLERSIYESHFLI
jgi:hypothetical protein